MLIWALTGAFYPAIDLCAGEKERGTLETLLSSPARRREIVWGKLLTINAFSIGSAVLNLMSMQLTTGLVVRSLASSGSSKIADAFGAMPLHSLGWLLLLLLPMSAFFSACSLAVAALAKSTKEGQYYLMPLLLITLPLVGLPMIPSMEMNLGTSMIPVSGAVFLVRSLIEGRIGEAMVYLPIVFLVTLLCCLLAIRWAIRQFESETVMFHEGGKWDMQLWLHHLWRDRQVTAQPSVALLCGVLILVGRFFAQFFVSPQASFVTVTILVQVGLILAPCVLMAMLLTRSPRKALRIHRTQLSHVTAAVLIGFALHPSYQVLGKAIVSIYPIGSETMLALQNFEGLVFQQELWVILLLLAALPAVCEELAFRGFIFGGLLRQQGVLRAVIVSALLFGFTHAILQQSISASVMGLLLGLIAWRTGGVFCTIIVHCINNGLSLTMAWCAKNSLAVPDALSWAIEAGVEGWSYQPEWQFISIVLSIALFLILFQRSRQTERVVLAEMA
jgi:sodium transport system permease protein